jgi:hypothetical protein
MAAHRRPSSREAVRPEVARRGYADFYEAASIRSSDILASLASCSGTLI